MPVFRLKVHPLELYATGQTGFVGQKIRIVKPKFIDYITIFWLYTYSSRICLHYAGALLLLLSPCRDFSQLSHNHSLRKAH